MFSKCSVVYCINQVKMYKHLYQFFDVLLFFCSENFRCLLFTSHVSSRQMCSSCFQCYKQMSCFDDLFITAHTHCSEGASVGFCLLLLYDYCCWFTDRLVVYIFMILFDKWNNIDIHMTKNGYDSKRGKGRKRGRLSPSTAHGEIQPWT